MFMYWQLHQPTLAQRSSLLPTSTDRRRTMRRRQRRATIKHSTCRPTISNMSRTMDRCQRVQIQRLLKKDSLNRLLIYVLYLILNTKSKKNL